MSLFTVKWIIKQLIKEMCGLCKCCYVITWARGEFRPRQTRLLP